ncbi:MAG: luciferase family protein, partial [Anaerolineales bacterium]
MSVRGAGEEIRTLVIEWPGVTAHPHRFGGTEYRLGRREFGHVHG